MARTTSLCLLLILSVNIFSLAGNAQDDQPLAAKVGRYSYSVNDHVISIATVNSKGQLRSDGFQPGDATLTYYSSAVDPLGRFFFGMTNFVCNAISVYSIAPGTGLLSLVPGSPFQASSLTAIVTGVLAVTPNGKFIYSLGNQDGGICGGHNVNNGITAFSIDPTTGALTQSPGSPFSDNHYPFRGVVDSQSKFLVTADVSSNSVSVFSIDPNTGALTPVAGSPFLECPTGLCSATFPVIAKNGILYILNHTMTISAFNMNPTTGFLTELTGSPFGGFCSTDSGLAADINGRFLYVSDGGGGLCVYAIDQQTGVPNIVPGSPFAAQANLLTANTDPKGKLLYAPSFTSYYTGMYKIPPTGALTLAGNVRGPHGNWATWFTTGTTAVSYVNKFAYVANSGANSISEYSINPDGTLFELPGSPLGDSNGPISVAATPAGTFVYALDANHKVSGYSVGGSGTLTAVTGSPFSGFTAPATVVTDPSNTYVFVVDGMTTPNPGVVWMEKIGANGALSLVNSTQNPSNTPVAATMTPGSDYLFVINSAEKAIASYQASYTSPPSISGLRGTAATGNGPSALAVDPSNNYVYVTNSGDGTVSGYKISDGNDGHNHGVPFAVTGSPFAAGTSPSAVIAEPSGKYLYVANSGSGNVFAYKINATSGKLTRIAGAFATGSAPDSLTVSNSGKFLYASNKSSGSVSVFTINANGTLTAGTAASTGTSPTSIAATGTRK